MSSDALSYSVLKNIEENLEQFKSLPIMIAWGAKDFVFNDHFLKRWQIIFPDAEVHRIPDAGHYVLEDAHELIIPLMQNFLQKYPL